MKTFKVEIIETVVSKGILLVNAKNKEAAEEQASEVFAEGNICDNPRYTFTTECDEGGVEFNVRS